MEYIDNSKDLPFLTKPRLSWGVHIKPPHFLITLHQIIHFKEDNILIRNNSIKPLNCTISHVWTKYSSTENHCRWLIKLPNFYSLFSRQFAHLFLNNLHMEHKEIEVAWFRYG